MDSRRASIVAFARAQVGKPYVWGAAGPNAYDCSGLVMAAYASVNVNVPHNSVAQYGVVEHIDRDQLQPGDPVFFESDQYGPEHMALYIGNGLCIVAPHTGDVVRVLSLDYLSNVDGYVGAGNYLGDAPAAGSSSRVPGAGRDQTGGATRPGGAGAGGVVAPVGGGTAQPASVVGSATGILEGVAHDLWTASNFGGWLGVSNILSLPQVLLRMLQTMITLVYFLTNRDNWLRLGEFLLGFFLLLSAIRVFAGGNLATGFRHLLRDTVGLAKAVK